MSGIDEKDSRIETHNAERTGAWLWQCGIVLPDGNPMEYPICPFCTASPFREFKKTLKLPDRCPECGAVLRQED